MNSAPDFLKAAIRIQEERGKEYEKEGGERSMGKIVAIFNLHHGTNLTEAQGWHFMEILKEAGLPDGVINLVYTDGPTVGDICFNHRDFAGVHFTGSTGVFQNMWKTIGTNIHKYRSYPRIVGETGGKDFVMVVAHKYQSGNAH